MFNERRVADADADDDADDAVECKRQMWPICVQSTLLHV